MRAFFVDRDGVITEDTAFSKVEKLKILPEAAEGIKKLNKLGLVIVVTNRPDIARGVFSEKEVNELHKKIKRELEDSGANIDAIYYCPHHPEKNHLDIPREAMKYRIDCQCRKPKIGLIERAVKDFNLDLKKCFIIGDSFRDMEAGVNAGVKTIFLGNGLAVKNEMKPDFTARNLNEAADLIEMNLKIKALILAGGKGERMRPLTDKLPKPMLPVAGKPVIQHQIEFFKKHGITKIVIAGHYLFDAIKNHFGSGEKFGVEIEYSDEEAPLGTGGAIKNAEKFLSGAENFIVINGDIMAEINLKFLYQFHNGKNSLATLTLRHTDHPLDSDIIEIDSNNKITKFIGKGQKELNLGNTGIFAFKKEIFNFIPEGFSIIEKDVLSLICGSEMIYGYLTDEYAKDMGTPERYESVKEYFEKKS